MNILVFSWRGPKDPNAGGAEYVAHEHAKAWIKAGYSVTLFTSYYQGAKRQEVIDKVEIIRRGYILLGVQIAAFQWYLFGRHKKFDLVVDCFHGIPFFTPLFVRQKRIAVIHEVAREIWFLNQVKFPFNLLIGFLGYVSEPLVFKLFYTQTTFITGSLSTKNDLITFGIPAKNIVIIHHAISTSKRRMITNKDKIAVFLGSLAKDKGIEDAIRVFSLLARSGDEWKYWIIGKGDETYLDKLRQMIVGFKLKRQIVFWGFVSNENKYELLSQAFVLVNPSYKEGWGLINVEANAMGTPVVGYDVAGTRDSVVDGKTGMLSKAGDYNDMAENVIKLNSNRKLYKKFQAQGIEWSNKFIWDKLTKQGLDLINKILTN